MVRAKVILEREDHDQNSKTQSVNISHPRPTHKLKSSSRRTGTRPCKHKYELCVLTHTHTHELLLILLYLTRSRTILPCTYAAICQIRHIRRTSSQNPVPRVIPLHLQGMRRSRTKHHSTHHTTKGPPGWRCSVLLPARPRDVKCPLLQNLRHAPN